MDKLDILIQQNAEIIDLLKQTLITHLVTPVPVVETIPKESIDPVLAYAETELKHKYTPLYNFFINNYKSPKK